ncbi:MAG: MCP four helix bundle domain-containing protein [Desulfatiglandaceae bacterium]
MNKLVAKSSFDVKAIVCPTRGRSILISDCLIVQSCRHPPSESAKCLNDLQPSFFLTTKPPSIMVFFQKARVLRSSHHTMPTMTKLTLFKRLVLGFLMILVILAALGIYSTVKLDQLNQTIRSINSVDGETIRMADRLSDTLLSQRTFERKYFVSQDRDFYHQFLETEKYIRKDLAQIYMLVDTTENARLLTDINSRKL